MIVFSTIRRCENRDVRRFVIVYFSGTCERLERYEACEESHVGESPSSCDSGTRIVQGRFGEGFRIQVSGKCRRHGVKSARGKAQRRPGFGVASQIQSTNGAVLVDFGFWIGWHAQVRPQIPLKGKRGWLDGYASWAIQVWACRARGGTSSVHRHAHTARVIGRVIQLRADR